jgi:hypothetical protein
LISYIAHIENQPILHRNNTMETSFDLNIGDMARQWTLSHAIRELIANALDEHTLFNPEADIEIYWNKDSWTIRDYGQGLNYHSFVFSHNMQKFDDSSSTIGKFGVGLKDALAVFERERVKVEIISKHGRFTFQRKEKCKDITTLHAIMEPTTQPDMEGTWVLLRGNIPYEAMQEAKTFFLRYNDKLKVVKSSKFGTVYKSSETDCHGEIVNRIYYNGHLIDTPKGFCFSYNIIKGDKKLNAHITRERFAIKKSAYMDRIVTILQNAKTKAVLGPLWRKMQDEPRNKGELGRSPTRKAVEAFGESRKKPAKAKSKTTPSESIKTLLTGAQYEIWQSLRNKIPEYYLVPSDVDKKPHKRNGITYLYIPVESFTNSETVFLAAMRCIAEHLL